MAEFSPGPYLDALRASRREFADLMLEKVRKAIYSVFHALIHGQMRAPDGTYEEGFVVPGTASSPAKTHKGTSNLEKNNPLSLHDDVRRFVSPIFPNFHMS